MGKQMPYKKKDKFNLKFFLSNLRALILANLSIKVTFALQELPT